MTTVTSSTTRPTDGGVDRVRALGDLAAGGVVALTAAVATWWLLGLPASYLVVAAGVYAALALGIYLLRPAALPSPGLGAANRVTLLRAALAVPVATLCLPPVALGTGGRWLVIALGTAVMVLDGLDGRVARRTGTRTDFGARFDMEIDAALILALAVLVWTEERAGVWCLLIGLLRYAFVAAGRVWPALRAELPESTRRKTICVVQGVVLLVALGPIIPVAVATTVVTVGLALLVYSFAVDTRWALEHQGRRP